MQFLHSYMLVSSRIWNMYGKRHAVVDNTDKIADYYASWKLGWGDGVKRNCEIIKLRFLKAPAS